MARFLPTSTLSEREGQLAVKNEVQEWWTKALLGQELSAHPVFGKDIAVEVDGDVVTVSGSVESAEQAEDIEREAASLNNVRAVVNKLKVKAPEHIQHMQTIIAVFSDTEAAQLGCQAVEAAWQAHEGHEPEVIEPNHGVDHLRERGRRAHVPEQRIERFSEALQRGKTLFVDHVPEDDALRIISVLEGMRAETIQALPPEPDHLEGE